KRLPVVTALELAIQLCEGLAEAHAKEIVHRDLKPANIFLTRASDGSQLVKILDFGISKWAQDLEQEGDLTHSGVVLGSPKYMAQEQFFAAGQVDARADVWSIGAIVYEMLTGSAPIQHANVATVCAELLSGTKPPPIRATAPEVPAKLEA